jgi:hypothetical protein
MQMFQQHQQKCDYIFSRLLEKVEMPVVKEIQFTDEQFEKQYAPLIFGHVVDKITNEICKLESIYEGWNYDKEESQKTSTFVFKNNSGKEFKSTAKTMQKAYPELRTHIRALSGIATSIIIP